jgi:hypothetical protein
VVALGEEDADAARARVLRDVRERLLDDPVERRLDLRRQPLVRKPRLELDVEAALLAERVREPLHRRDEPEVVECRGP